MENDYILSGLLRKRAELAGQLEAAQAEVRRINDNLDAVDTTIRLFKPDIALEDIRPKPLAPRHAAYKGEVSRIIFTMLREVDHPVTSAELAVRVMTERDLNTGDKKLARTMLMRVNACLRHYRTRGLIQSEPGGPGGRVLWSVGA